MAKTKKDYLKELKDLGVAITSELETMTNPKLKALVAKTKKDGVQPVGDQSADQAEPAAQVEPPVPVNSNAPVEPEIEDGKCPVNKDGTAKPIEGTGKYVVVQYSDGYRMYNEKGVAVSPLTKPDEKNAEGKNLVSIMSRQAARSNALRRNREIRTPRGHELE